MKYVLSLCLSVFTLFSSITFSHGTEEEHAKEDTSEIALEATRLESFVSNPGIPTMAIIGVTILVLYLALTVKKRQD